MKRPRTLLFLVCLLGALAVPAQANAAQLILGPPCIQSSEQVVHAELHGVFGHFPSGGTFFEVTGPSGEYVDATFTDVTWSPYLYTFNIHLPAGLPAGNYKVSAYGQRPPPDGDIRTLKVGPACDSVLLGKPDYVYPGEGRAAVSGNVKRASPFVLFRSASVRKLGVYLDGGATTAGNQRVRGVLYANAQGKPAALLGQTFDFTVPAGMVGQWVELFMAPPVRVPPGVYWLGIQTAPPTGTWNAPAVARFAWNSKPSSRRYNIDVFADGPSAAFGDTVVDDLQIAIFASGSY